MLAVRVEIHAESATAEGAKLDRLLWLITPKHFGHVQLPPLHCQMTVLPYSGEADALVDVDVLDEGRSCSVLQFLVSVITVDFENGKLYKIDTSCEDMIQNIKVPL